MAWTTRIVRIDIETGEVLEDHQLIDYDYVKSEKIYNKINETHNENIIIKHYRRTKQQRIKF